MGSVDLRGSETPAGKQAFKAPRKDQWKLLAGRIPLEAGGAVRCTCYARTEPCTETGRCLNIKPTQQTPSPVRFPEGHPRRRGAEEKPRGAHTPQDGSNKETHTVGVLNKRRPGASMHSACGHGCRKQMRPFCPLTL